MEVKGKTLVKYGRKSNTSLHTGRFAHQKNKKNNENQLFAVPRGEKSPRQLPIISLPPKVSMDVRVKTLVPYEGKSYLLFERGVEKRFLHFLEKSTGK